MSDSSLFDAALAIAEEQRALLEKMRDALERGDNDTAPKFARELCGLAARTPKLR